MIGAMRIVACALVLLASCGPHTTLRATSAGSVTRASTATAATDAGIVPSELPHAWLWRVSGGDSASASYVLGTMHVGIRMPDALPHPYDAYLHDARALVMEVDLREADRVLRESAQTAPHGRRRPLDRALGRESWDRLVAELGAHIPPDVLRLAPPGALTLYLQQVRMAEAEAISEGREPIPGVPSSARLDATIFDWAVRQAMPIVALETPEQALAALDSIAAEQDVLTMLHAEVDDAEAARARADAMRAAYLVFDEPAMLDWLAREMPASVRDALLLQRNRAWEAALFPQIQQGNAFVAVGLGHLLGEGSVLEALAAHGYRVERLGPSSP
jgi:uncharacterized protein YbaP (TraB family)